MIGTLLDNRFELCEELGTGGMATIYRAHDKETEIDVAVKVLKGRRAATVEYRERFHREYELCARLDHPNIVKMFHFGQVDEKRSYYAMELLPQRNLDSLLRDKGAQDEGVVLEYLLQLCSAFQYIHEKDIVHRDLKPENVMLRNDNTLAITDFGIARSAEQSPLTGTGITMGTPNYISPEVLLGNEANERSDIFALGIIAYELLSGENPFGANALGDVIEKIVSYQPPQLKSLQTSISELWDPIVFRCLHKRPDGRYENVSQLRDDIESIARSLGKEIVIPQAPEAKPKQGGCASRAAMIIGLLLWTLS